MGEKSLPKYFKKWAFAQKKWAFGKNEIVKFALCPEKVGFCPVLKHKSGLEEWLTYAVFEGFCPLSHFFYIF